MTEVKHWYYCWSNGRELTSANIRVCKVKGGCATNPAEAIAGSRPLVVAKPDVGGPACAYDEERIVEYCANGTNPATHRPNPWVAVSEWGYPTSAFDYSHAENLWNDVKHAWKNHVLKRCTAALIGSATGAVIVAASGGSTAPVVWTIVGGTTSGCVAGALNFFWSD